MSSPRNIFTCCLRAALLLGPVTAAVVTFALLLNSQDEAATNYLDTTVTAAIFR